MIIDMDKLTPVFDTPVEYQKNNPVKTLKRNCCPICESKEVAIIEGIEYYNDNKLAICNKCAFIFALSFPDPQETNKLMVRVGFNEFVDYKQNLDRLGNPMPINKAVFTNLIEVNNKSDYFIDDFFVYPEKYKTCLDNKDTLYVRTVALDMLAFTVMLGNSDAALFNVWRTSIGSKAHIEYFFNQLGYRLESVESIIDGRFTLKFVAEDMEIIKQLDFETNKNLFESAIKTYQIIQDYERFCQTNNPKRMMFEKEIFSLHKYQLHALRIKSLFTEYIDFEDFIIDQYERIDLMPDDIKRTYMLAAFNNKEYATTIELFNQIKVKTFNDNRLIAQYHFAIGERLKAYELTKELFLTTNSEVDFNMLQSLYFKI